MSAPFDMFSSFVELREGGALEQRPRELFRDWGLWTMAAFHAEGNEAVHSDVWELHPLGDELLCLLSGMITVHLRSPANEATTTTTLHAGTCYVVPAGVWHRLTVEEPGDLVAITPRASTAHEALPQ
jgi:mannose-6-phosphate isomerase-like protein (cupin superfamily)